jgi:hypothetical protein
MGFSFDPIPNWERVEKEKETIDFFLNQKLSIIPVKRSRYRALQVHSQEPSINLRFNVSSIFDFPR